MSYIPESPNNYIGKQVIINSDRLIFNAKDDSILLFSDKAIGFSTNGSIHFDTSKEKDGEEASNFIINSPNIYLGLTYNDRLPTNSAVLGDELEELLIDILKVSSSTSIKYGLAPNIAIDSAVAGNVKAGQNTISPGPIS